MRKHFFIALFTLLASTSFGQEVYDTLYINMTDGVSKINIEEIDSITFTPAAATVAPENGTVVTKNKAAICWIDDDFLVKDNSGNMRPIYETVHDWCIEKDIRFDFAYIPGGISMSVAQTWEEEGFNFLMHPFHDGWYNYGTQKHDITTVRKSFIKCMRVFQQYFASAKRRILVWPGSSNSYPENVEFISQYVECAITATTIGSNPGTENDRYQLKRLSLMLGSKGNNMTKTQLKNLIKQYVDNGDWVILYTHLYNHENTDVVDETTNSVANLMEIVEYANSLCPLRSTESIWDERKLLYDGITK